jgi:hypothetical protein
MLFTTFNLPEDVHLLASRTGHRSGGDVRVDGRPPTAGRAERSVVRR